MRFVSQIVMWLFVAGALLSSSIYWCWMESHFSWQVQHLVMLESHFWKQAQHLAMLDRHFSWPGQHFVMLASWQARHLKMLERHFSWQRQHYGKTVRDSRRAKSWMFSIQNALQSAKKKRRTGGCEMTISFSGHAQIKSSAIVSSWDLCRKSWYGCLGQVDYIVGDVGASPFVAGACGRNIWWCRRVTFAAAAICIWCWHVSFRGRGSIGDFGMSLFVAGALLLERHTIWWLCNVTFRWTCAHESTRRRIISHERKIASHIITSKWDHATWRHITSHDMTWHLATNHIIPKVTSPHNQPHYTASHLAANHIKSPRGHSISKFFLWLVVFSLWNFRPRLARLYLNLKISRVACQKLCPSHTLWRQVCETWTNTQMISNQVNGCRNLQHSRFPCAFSTFGVLEIKRGIAHMCGLLVFVKLWNASSEVLEEPCVPAGQLCGLRCLCGKNGVSLGIATAWYRIDHRSEKHSHCYL